MSDVKRYLAKMSWTQIETQEHPNGEFVLWQDYARLKAEVERLNYKLGRLLGAEREWVLVEPEEYQRLKSKEGNQS